MKTSKINIVTILLVNSFIGTFSISSQADCFKIQGGNKLSFNGDSLSGLVVDRKAMAELNKLFPQLQITEKVFSGNLQTCSDCHDNYISCSE